MNKYEVVIKGSKKAFGKYKALSSIFAVGYSVEDAIERLLKVKPNMGEIKSISLVA